MSLPDPLIDDPSEPDIVLPPVVEPVVPRGDIVPDMPGVVDEAGSVVGDVLGGVAPMPVPMLPVPVLPMPVLPEPVLPAPVPVVPVVCAIAAVANNAAAAVIKIVFMLRNSYKVMPSVPCPTRRSINRHCVPRFRGPSRCRVALPCANRHIRPSRSLLA